MWTKCPDQTCGIQFKVSDNMFGKTVECKKCGNEFKAMFSTEPPPAVDIFEKEERKENSQQELKQEIIQRIKSIQDRSKNYIPQLEAAQSANENESGTRMIIDRILQDVLGYNFQDIRTEQKIEGGRADYVLSLNGRDMLVIEAKRIGLKLKEKQVFQAATYGAFSGITWVLLTNAAVWELYRVSADGKVKTERVFALDLREGLDNETGQYMYLLSRHGMEHPGFIENLWKKISALCYENIMETILSDGIIPQLRACLCKKYGCNLSDKDVRRALENNIFDVN